MKCKNNICFFLALLIISFTLFLNIPKGSSSYHKEVKRGYILDRSGEPLVVNRESYQAYFVVKNKSFLGNDIPKEIKAYLPEYFQLPKKGLVLLSENLTFEEAQNLRKIDNIVIKGEVRRSSLFAELKPLVGVSSGSEGISGLEKVFNHKLKEGDSLTLALDLNLCKKIYNYAKQYATIFPQNLAIFKKDTGELIAFFSKDDKNFLLEIFLITTNSLSFPVEEVNWELESQVAKREGAFIWISPMHIVKAYMSDYCGVSMSPTLLPTRESHCKKVKPSQEALYFYLPHKRQWLSFLHKENYLYVFSGTFPEEILEEDFSWDKLKKNLNYFVNLF